MNTKHLSKEEVTEKIKKIFKSKPTSEQIKKVRKLAMSKNLKLKDSRRKFCKKCNSFFNSNNSEIRIKKGFKIIRCKNCGYIDRYKLK